MNKKVIILVSIIFLALIFSGIYFYLQSQKKQSPSFSQRPATANTTPATTEPQIFKTMKQVYPDLIPLIDSEGKENKIIGISSVPSGDKISKERGYEIRPDGTSNYWVFLVIYPQNIGCNIIWANGSTEKWGCGGGVLWGSSYEKYQGGLQINSIPDSSEYFAKTNALMGRGTVGELALGINGRQEIGASFNYYDDKGKFIGIVECGVSLDSCKKLPGVVMNVGE